MIAVEIGILLLAEHVLGMLLAPLRIAATFLRERGVRRNNLGHVYVAFVLIQSSRPLRMAHGVCARSYGRVLAALDRRDA